MSAMPPSTPPVEPPEGFAAPGVLVKDDKRPELIFATRRKFLVVFFIAVILLVCWFYVDRLSNPLSGIDQGLTGGAYPKTMAAQTAIMRTGGLAVSATAVVPNVNTSSLMPGNQGVQPSSGGSVPGAMQSVACRALSDLGTSVGRILNQSLVRVGGFSYARSGMYFVIDPDVGWVDALYLTCPPEVVRLERPYLIAPTATGTRVPYAAGVRQTVVVPQTVIVIATANGNSGSGIYVDSGGCVVFNISNVRSIFADGNPVAGGARICNVNSFTVNVR